MAACIATRESSVSCCVWISGQTLILWPLLSSALERGRAPGAGFEYSPGSGALREEAVLPSVQIFWIGLPPSTFLPMRGFLSPPHPGHMDGSLIPCVLFRKWAHAPDVVWTAENSRTNISHNSDALPLFLLLLLMLSFFFFISRVTCWLTQSWWDTRAFRLFCVNASQESST